MIQEQYHPRSDSNKMLLRRRRPKEFLVALISATALVIFLMTHYFQSPSRPDKTETTTQSTLRITTSKSTSTARSLESPDEDHYEDNDKSRPRKWREELMVVGPNGRQERTILGRPTGNKDFTSQMARIESNLAAGMGDLDSSECPYSAKEKCRLLVLIVAKWRSGSTFLGQVFAAHPAAWYMYEPFNYLGRKLIRNSTLAAEKLDLFLSCGYSDTSLAEFVAQRPYFEQNPRLWTDGVCSDYEFDACADGEGAEFASDACAKHPVNVVKTVRLRLEDAEKAMERHPNLHVLYLVRDPRATWASRTKAFWSWCRDECASAPVLCGSTAAEYPVAERMVEMYPRRFTVLRYEDFSVDPVRLTTAIFTKMGLKVTSGVRKFMREYTQDDGSSYNGLKTHANTRRQAFKWIEDGAVSLSHIRRLQTLCSSAMDSWGYRKVSGIRQLADLNSTLPCDICLKRIRLNTRR